MDGRAVGMRLCLALAFGMVTGIGCAGKDEPDPLDVELAKVQKDKKSKKPAECHPGLVEACYSGPKATAGRGMCREGTHTCDANGYWLACEGEALPATMELCNNNDDDCNGIVDDGFSREGTKCWAGEGECKATGTFKCSADGSKSECNAVALPGKAEVCDGKDNDCDGKIDEDITEGTGATCSTGKAGVCSQGTKQCAGGSIQCVPNKVGTPEICDSKADEDCDGEVDEKDCVPAGG